MSSTSLRGRRIVLGVCGGVAAYKAAELCRELVRRGAFVSPVLTASAERFMGAATFSALASEPARTSLWESPEPSPHTTLGQAADLVVVAPATANLLAAARTGASHDLLTTTLLATRAPVLLCPAMHTEMWEHAAVVENVAVLEARGVHLVLPVAGDLAGGDVGVGRLADPVAIADRCERLLLGRPMRELVKLPAPLPLPEQDLAELHVLVSAGGTREPLDPVRYLGNRSSGKQGHAIAAVAAARGAKVTLVTTVDLPSPIGSSVVRLDTAQEMHDAMLARAASADVIVMAAAVADYRPSRCADHKLKRREGVPEVVLEATPDILGELVAARRPRQTIVGFAAETNDVEDNAQRKLRSTGVDLLVANDVSAPGAGFEHDTNAVTILRAGGAPPHEVALRSKELVASEVLDAVVECRAGEPATRVQVRGLREVR